MTYVGLPDPPSEVQVEAGPQDGTLLVTWLPVTTTLSDPSNRGHITGYAVYADGKKVSDIDSPTGKILQNAFKLKFKNQIIIDKL
jgi:RIMS-binding protein 2